MNAGSFPASVQELVDILEMDTVMKLVRELGGTTFPVPKKESKQGEVRFRMLAEVIGEEEAGLVVYHFGGEELYIPRCAKALQERRDAEIKRKFMEGSLAGRSSTDIVNELAILYNISDRRVWSILKSPEPPVHKQMSIDLT